jgi:hypothetical protein
MSYAGISRATAGLAVRLCLKYHIHADAISYASMVFAAAAAICFWRSGERLWLLIVAPLFCYLRLWCNMLDGMVALAAGRASLHGEILLLVWFGHSPRIWDLSVLDWTCIAIVIGCVQSIFIRL